MLNNNTQNAAVNTLEEIIEYSDTQKFKVLDYYFYDNLTENDEEAGKLKLLNTVNGESLSLSIWLSDLKEGFFYICIPNSIDDEDDVVNVEDFNIFYDETKQSS